MADFNTSKQDGQGNTVAAAEWNQLADVDNFTTSAGLTPSTSNLNQLGISSARYSSAGNYFTDSGTANAYVLSSVSPFNSPVSATAGEGYFVGMKIRFRAGNANTGASTVNVNSAGVKNIVLEDGTNLSAGDIPANTLVELYYNGTNFILNPKRGYRFLNLRTFTSSGTYTPTAGTRAILVKLVGGGGGGAGSNSSTVCVGGGGGGGGAESFLTTFTSTVAMTVGAGGTAGSSANGGNGGTTSFGSYLSATGGTGGITGSGNGSAGGVGTVSSGNGFAVNGSGGGTGQVRNSSGNGDAGGAGGNSMLGGGGRGGSYSGTAGGAGSVGGGGGSALTTGGAGGGGIIIVYEYF